MFNEDTFEKMVCDTLSQNGWTYIPSESLPRQYSDVMVEPMVKEALIRLNPCIAVFLNLVQSDINVCPSQVVICQVFHCLNSLFDVMKVSAQ